MKKYILFFGLLFYFCSSYGQPEEIIGIEQERVYNDLIGNPALWVKPVEFDVQTFPAKPFRVRVFTRGTRILKGKKDRIKRVFQKLYENEISFESVPGQVTIDIYLIKSNYRPSFNPRYPNIERYDGLSEHQIMVLTRRADWHPVCNLFINTKGEEMLENRLIYGIGRLLHEWNMPRDYWAEHHIINKPSRLGSDPNSPQVNQVLAPKLNRYALHSHKAYVGELFLYSLTEDLMNVLPNDYFKAKYALNAYIDPLRGPMSPRLHAWRAELNR